MGKRIVIEVAGEREDEIAYETVRAAVETFRRNLMDMQFTIHQEQFMEKRAFFPEVQINIPAFMFQRNPMSSQEKGMREALYGKHFREGGGEDG